MRAPETGSWMRPSGRGSGFSAGADTVGTLLQPILIPVAAVIFGGVAAAVLGGVAAVVSQWYLWRVARSMNDTYGAWRGRGDRASWVPNEVTTFLLLEPKGLWNSRIYNCTFDSGTTKREL